MPKHAFNNYYANNFSFPAEIKYMPIYNSLCQEQNLNSSKQKINENLKEITKKIYQEKREKMKGKSKKIRKIKKKKKPQGMYRNPKKIQ